MRSKTSGTAQIFPVLLISVVFLLARGEASHTDSAGSVSCRNSDVISWITPASPSDKAKLDRWCETVGPALVRQPKSPLPERLGRVLVVNWNVHLGNGQIQTLIQQLTEEERNAGRAEPHFVFLLQEAFRRGVDVPQKIKSTGRTARRIPSAEDDIAALAATLDWWMFYAPSMRNGDAEGDAAEDRGNAILSTLPLEQFQAIELPFSVQRRVAVSAVVNDEPRGHRFQVLSVHLDTRAPMSSGFIFRASAARNRQAKWIAESLTSQSPADLPLIVGGDLNTYLGFFESSDNTLAKIAPRLDCGKDATHKTGFRLDHMFARFPASMSGATCRRTETRFDSDHYPLVLTLP